MEQTSNTAIPETFRLGAYYRRKTGGPAYRCEAVTCYRALLYLCARLKSEIDLEPRVRVHLNEYPEWEPITSHAEFVHLEKIYNYYLAQEFPGGPHDGIAQRQYHVDKYLKFIADEDKKERQRNVVNNLVWVNRDGSRENLPPADGGLKFLEALAHLAEDLRLQKKPDDFYEMSHFVPIKEKISKLYPDIDDILSDLPDTEKNGLYKFSEAQFARKLFFYGKARISLASHFKKTEHNAAIHDKHENSIIVRVSRDARPLEITQGEHTILRSDETDKMIALEFHPNFPSYLYCVSKLCDPRYFFDFDADAYVHIPQKHIQEFARRLNEGVKKALAPWRTTVFGRDVIYYDPLRICDDLPEKWGQQFLVETHKDFRYEYQREYRFIFPVPETGATLPETIDVEIGPLTDIAELFVLKKSRTPEDEGSLSKAVA